MKLGSLEVNKEGKLIEQTNIFGNYSEVTGIYSIRIKKGRIQYYWYYNYSNK